jgi:hypothetical protein
MSGYDEFVAEHRAEIDELIAKARADVEHWAVYELARRRKEWGPPLDFSHEPGWLWSQSSIEREERYRRGYVQGYSDAMDALRADCKPSAWTAMAEWFDTTLYRWRRVKNPSMEPPPGYWPRRNTLRSASGVTDGR